MTHQHNAPQPEDVPEAAQSAPEQSGSAQLGPEQSEPPLPESGEAASTPRSLAARQAIDARPPALLGSYRALPTLAGWFSALRAYCANPAPEDERAADWILDNDYQVIRAMRRLREDLPRSYYDQLPALAGAAQPGTPRAFALASALYDTLDPQITLSGLTAFLDTYQTHAPLTNAEVWAMPSMLRLVCVERLIHATGDMAPKLTPAVRLSAETLATRDARPVDRIAKAITSLIAIDAIKWADFVDQVSPIEAALALDPAGVYPAMTFDTRNRYRRRIEQLCQRCDRSEPAVAHVAVGLSRTEADGSPRRHVGYWLVGDGLPRLEAAVDYRDPPLRALRRRLARHRGLLYAAGLLALVAAASMVPVVYLWMLGATPLQWILGIALTLLPATIPSVWLGHWIITRWSVPQPLPEMDYSKAVPPDCATAIVVPVILQSEAEVARLAEKIEVLRLANPDPAFRFVLLSDPTDAATRTVLGDAALETALRQRIAELNRRHDAATGGRVVLLHRHRRYNPAEGCWMAWERKRGKLEEFNRLVLGEDCGAFSVVEGPVKSLRGIRYAITLDADTQLPPGAAARLVGIIAHPLNRADFDPESGRIARGHAIVQPRIEILPQLGKGTHFTHLFGGDTAVDIYSRAVSDVYQDLFGTGIYVGKGIYDIAALHRSIAGRVPENHILSHDLFEGLYGRAALASNVVLYEDLPASYPEYALRHHRWMRGDWQLLPWLGRSVPTAGGGRTRTSLSVLDRWKMVDNLRRSLMPPALLLFFLGAWLVLPGSALVWTLLAAAAPGSYLFGEAFEVATGGIRRGALGDAVHRIRTTAGRWFFSIVFLVSDTMISLDAIARAIWRLQVSGRKRLEWTSAAHAAASRRRTSVRRASWRLMWPSSAIALVLAGHLALSGAARFWPAAPVLLLWLIAPEISVWSARPRYFRTQMLSASQRRFLTLVARRTWHFFETFVGPDDNWLPPDNFQFGARQEVAHRTSPTNIGMFLVSALAARDMGFITTGDFLARCRNTVDALGRVAGYRGHVLNWYDTRTLEPLEPQYVSTVDSGNLAVCLIALKQGCFDLAEEPVIAPGCFSCLDTTLELLCTAIRAGSGHDDAALGRTERTIRTLIARTHAAPLTWAETHAALRGDLWQDLETHARDTIDASPELLEVEVLDITTWLERYHHDLHAIGRDTDTYMPWLRMLAGAPADLAQVAQALADHVHPAEGGHGDPSSASGFLEKLADWEAGQPGLGPVARAWLDQLKAAAQDAVVAQTALHNGLLALAERADAIAYAMDFGFLYDPATRLFWIGYNQSLGKMDTSHYDLLATEARLASYFAIAKHDAPIEHWFAFSRPVTRLQGKPSILSWNGSMFEYLMPPLFLPSYRDTLLGESELTAVDFQRAYAGARSVPWGISESAFGTTDAQGTFQYRAFGVPGLGIRRGLTDDLVIAPYGSALALCGWPVAATANLAALADLGALTRHGFLEALDFTPERAAPGEDFVPVTTFMAHHQGMVQTAIVNALKGDIMVRRFLREKPVRAMDLLLQERVPWDAPLEPGRADEVWDHAPDTAPAPDLAPWVPSPDFVVPQVHHLGNGTMASLVTASGGGGLSVGDVSLTRWHPDPTRTAHGLWCYLQDPDSGDLWSLGTAPTRHHASEMRCVFHQHMAEFLCRHGDIVARMDVTVAPYDDVEIRRVTLINEGSSDRTIDLTTYAEVVLAPPLEDERHPAFSKLFVHSTYLAQSQALLFERRPRRPETRPPVMLHALVSADPDTTLRGWETDRARFIGRNHDTRAPEGLRAGLSGTTGWTLDPVMALQTRVALKPMETRQLVFLTVTGAARGDVLQIANRYPAATIDRAFRDALFETGRAVQKLGVESSWLPELQVLSSLLVHIHQTLRTSPPPDGDPWNGQADLWRFGISGDHPVLLLELPKPDGSPLLDTLVRGHGLWRRAGLKVDLVVLRDVATSYEEPLREKVLSILSDTNATSLLGMRGGIHLLAAEQLAEGLRRGVEAAAHVVLRDDGHSLREMLDHVLETEGRSPPFAPGPAPAYDAVAPLERPDDLLFDNGYGGFDPATGDYLIHLEPGMRTPAPWCNVLANEGFGCLVSEAGFGTTWGLNSGEHRLTPWSNDPVTDTPGEVVYLRDEADGTVWTPTPAPMGQGAACQIRHGPGLTCWRQNSQGLEQELECFVPTDQPVKLVRLRLRNLSGQARRISATYYAEWLLGAMGTVSRPHVVSRYDAGLRAITGRNRWNAEFAARVAFLTASVDPHSVTGDRHAFLGRGGDVFDPDGLRRWDLGGRFAPGGDPCAAYQVHLDLPPGGRSEVVFALGEVASQDQLAQAVAHWRNPAAAETALREVRQGWHQRLTGVQAKTPDPAFDLMVNTWLPYQNRACRLMARAGFYQAGGAFGFRDQLQDVLALLHSDPAVVRAHILRAAAHQFEAGDVLHWWHPPAGRGVRTRCSDDYLWLVFVTARYIAATGDRSVLDAAVPFLRAPDLAPDEHDRYALFDTGDTATLYEHCARALDLMMATGPHDLPLMGTGDWNDGMDRVGDQGRGESIWLAWFQIATVGMIAPIARKAGHDDAADRWQAHADHLARALAAHGWDGDWYRRAYDDDGLPWGAAANDECRIDLIAQAWAVLSGLPPDARTFTALASAADALVDPKARLIRLLTPPFDKTDRDPGYIHAYPPGIRENGGQYTHAAAWLGLAYAALGDGDGAYRVFDLINPITRVTDRAGADHYRREPYVLCGDVSGVGAQTGQGGWSWYTGAAGWTWQLGVEGILGAVPDAGGIRLSPCLPKGWGHAELTLDGPEGRLRIKLEDPENIGHGTHGTVQVTVDGQPCTGTRVSYPGAGQTAEVVVTIKP